MDNQEYDKVLDYVGKVLDDPSMFEEVKNSKIWTDEMVFASMREHYSGIFNISEAPDYASFPEFTYQLWRNGMNTVTSARVSFNFALAWGILKSMKKDPENDEVLLKWFSALLSFARTQSCSETWRIDLFYLMLVTVPLNIIEKNKKKFELLLTSLDELVDFETRKLHRYESNQDIEGANDNMQRPELDEQTYAFHSGAARIIHNILGGIPKEKIEEMQSSGALQIFAYKVRQNRQFKEAEAQIASFIRNGGLSAIVESLQLSDDADPYAGYEVADFEDF